VARSPGHDSGNVDRAPEERCQSVARRVAVAACAPRYRWAGRDRQQQRPEVHNAASDAFNRRLWEVFYELHLRDDIRCVIWRGQRQVVLLGARSPRARRPRDGGMSHLQHIERGHRWTQMLFSCPAPIIVSLKAG
jgi:hypothetical protein